jgi:hypothetical protein
MEKLSNMTKQRVLGSWLLNQYTECGISQLTENADNECKNEAKAQIVTCY